MHNTKRPLGHWRLSRKMTIATEHKQQVKKTVGRAGHEGLIRNKRQPVCLCTRLQWMHSGGTLCSQRLCPRQGLAFPRVRKTYLKEQMLGSKAEVRQIWLYFMPYFFLIEQINSNYEISKAKGHIFKEKQEHISSCLSRENSIITSTDNASTGAKPKEAEDAGNRVISFGFPLGFNFLSSLEGKLLALKDKKVFLFASQDREKEGFTRHLSSSG